MKRSDRLILLLYLIAAGGFAVHAAVRFGLIAFTGTGAQFRSDLFGFRLHLSDYILVRSNSELNHLYFVNLLRGLLLLTALYLLAELLPLRLKKLLGVYPKASGKAKKSERKEEPAEMHLFRKKENAPASASAAADPFSEISAEDAEDGDFAPEPAETYFSDLSAERDNVRVIVKITQYGEDGEPPVSFFCGDTVGLHRYPTTSLRANTTLGAGEIKEFIRETRTEQGGVFYVYDIREASQLPVMLSGEQEDAVRVVSRRVILRIYRQQLLFIAPQQDIRTVDNETQAPSSVWAVAGTNNSASQTRSYVGKFYNLDEAAEYEVEVRIKL